MQILDIFPFCLQPAEDIVVGPAMCVLTGTVGNSDVTTGLG